MNGETEFRFEIAQDGYDPDRTFLVVANWTYTPGKPANTLTWPGDPPEDAEFEVDFELYDVVDGKPFPLPLDAELWLRRAINFKKLEQQIFDHIIDSGE